MTSAEKEADLMVGMADNGPVVTVVTTSLVIVTSLQTVLEVRDGDQVVDGPARPAPARHLGGCRGEESIGTGQKH